jgi:hypothetical protein
LDSRLRGKDVQTLQSIKLLISSSLGGFWGIDGLGLIAKSWGWSGYDLAIKTSFSCLGVATKLLERFEKQLDSVAYSSSFGSGLDSFSFFLWETHHRCPV